MAPCTGVALATQSVCRPRAAALISSWRMSRTPWTSHRMKTNPSTPWHRHHRLPPPRRHRLRRPRRGHPSRGDPRPYRHSLARDARDRCHAPAQPVSPTAIRMATARRPLASREAAPGKSMSTASLAVVQATRAQHASLLLRMRRPLAFLPLVTGRTRTPPSPGACRPPECLVQTRAVATHPTGTATTPTGLAARPGTCRSPLTSASRALATAADRAKHGACTWRRRRRRRG